MGLADGASLPGQLPERKSSSRATGEQARFVRIVGRQSLRPAAVRDVLQVLQRKAVGHSLRGIRRRFRRPADQEVLARARRWQRTVFARAPRGTRRWSIASPIRSAAPAASTKRWPSRSRARRRIQLRRPCDGSSRRTSTSPAWNWPTGASSLRTGDFDHAADLVGARPGRNSPRRASGVDSLRFRNTILVYLHVDAERCSPINGSTSIRPTC